MKEINNPQLIIDIVNCHDRERYAIECLYKIIVNNDYTSLNEIYNTANNKHCLARSIIFYSYHYCSNGYYKNIYFSTIRQQKAEWINVNGENTYRIKVGNTLYTRKELL